jgi:hypothetical protein
VIALSALVVFGAGLAVGQFVFPGSTVRSAATVSPLTRSASAPAPAPAGKAQVHVARTSAREIDRPQTTAAKVRHQRPQPAARKPAIPSRTRSTPPIATVPAPTPARKAKAPAAQVPASEPTQTPARPIPYGGYIFAKGRMQLSDTGRTIVEFVLATRCGGSLALPSIDVGNNGTFSFAGHPPGSAPGTTVRVEGRFVSPREARGTTQAVRDTCRAPATAFVARLS